MIATDKYELLEKIQKLAPSLRASAEEARKSFDALAQTIKTASAIDCEPVVHSMWLQDKNEETKTDSSYCARCQFFYTKVDNFKYCPSCGALMDGKGLEVPYGRTRIYYTSGN